MIIIKGVEVDESSKMSVFNFLLKNPRYSSSHLIKSHFPNLYENLLNSYNLFPDIFLSFGFSQKLYHYLLDDFSLLLGKCKCCRNRCSFISFKKGYRTCCSYKCAANDIDKINRGLDTQVKNNKIKYGRDFYMGSDDFKRKSKETLMNLYNVDNYTKTEEYKNHIIELNNEKYGCDYFVLTDEFKKKSKKTCISHFNVDNCMKNKDIQNKSKETKLIRYGDENYRNVEKFIISMTSKTPEEKQSIQIKKDNTRINNYGSLEESYKSAQEKYKITCQNKYGVNNYFQLLDDQSVYHFSKGEKELSKFISTIYSGKIIENDRTVLNGFEIDILLPDLKIGFEYNGDYWHANPNIYDENFINLSSKMTYKEIHEKDDKKIKLASNMGYTIITIWENDWIHNHDYIKKMILDLLNQSKNILQ